MKDETYVFIHDVKEKGSTARSARNRRTHAGKGGRARLPSDNLTKKELEAMNGEMKSYKMNSPITWAEFKEMPDDIQKMYLLGIHNKWNVPYSEIAKMMGSYQQKLAREMKRLGISSNNHAHTKWDREGFYAWVNGALTSHAPIDECMEETTVEESAAEEFSLPVTVKCTPVIGEVCEEEKLIPCSGNMKFSGSAEAALKTMIGILGNANVTIELSWVVE